MNNLNSQPISEFTLKFAFFMMKFLPELIANSSKFRFKSKSKNQRVGGDRRKSTPKQRLSFGTWLAYERVSGEGRFTMVSLNESTRMKIEDSLPKEVIKYSFVRKSDGTVASPTEVLEESIDRAWRYLIHQYSLSAKAIYITEEIVNRIDEIYYIHTIERRTSGQIVQLHSKSELLAS